jgi:hypothetical protein
MHSPARHDDAHYIPIDNIVGYLLAWEHDPAGPSNSSCRSRAHAVEAVVGTRRTERRGCADDGFGLLLAGQVSGYVASKTMLPAKMPGGEPGRHIINSTTLWPLCDQPHNGQVITGDNAARRAEDIGGQELSYAEVKAIASGNPAVLTLAEADAELQRLTLLNKNHLDEQYVARRNVRDLPATIASLSERLSKLSADEATTKSHADDPTKIGSRTYPREDIQEILGGKLDGLPKNVRETTRIPIGNYRGLRFGLVLHSQFPPDVYLEVRLPVSPGYRGSTRDRVPS